MCGRNRASGCFWYAWVPGRLSTGAHRLIRVDGVYKTLRTGERISYMLSLSMSAPRIVAYWLLGIKSRR